MKEFLDFDFIDLICLSWHMLFFCGFDFDLFVLLVSHLLINYIAKDVALS